MVKRQRARRELSQPSIIKQDSYSPEFLSLSIATVAASPLLSTHQSCQSHCERMLQFLDCLKCSFSAADAGILLRVSGRRSVVLKPHHTYFQKTVRQRLHGFEAFFYVVWARLAKCKLSTEFLQLFKRHIQLRLSGKPSLVNICECSKDKCVKLRIISCAPGSFLRKD